MLTKLTSIEYLIMHITQTPYTTTRSVKKQKYIKRKTKQKDERAIGERNSSRMKSPSDGKKGFSGLC